jgi:N-acetyl-anhydromuramyl-L-alanine amidase AmpD
VQSMPVLKAESFVIQNLKAVKNLLIMLESQQKENSTQKKNMNVYNPKIRWNPQGKDLKPKGIVVHAMMESFSGRPAWEFLHEDLGISVHAMISEDTYLFEENLGGARYLRSECKYLAQGHPVLIECQSTDKVAYHAGKSRYKSFTNLNSSFLGIELLVNKTPYNGILAGKGIDVPLNQMHFIINNIDWIKVPMFDILVNWCVEQMKEYDIPIENVIQHSDCAGDDIRGKGKGKQDAGKMFNRYVFYKNLQTKLTGERPNDKWVKELINEITA